MSIHSWYVYHYTFVNREVLRFVQLEVPVGSMVIPNQKTVSSLGIKIRLSCQSVVLQCHQIRMNWSVYLMCTLLEQFSANLDRSFDIMRIVKSQQLTGIILEISRIKTPFQWLPQLSRRGKCIDVCVCIIFLWFVVSNVLKLAATICWRSVEERCIPMRVRARVGNKMQL